MMMKEQIMLKIERVDESRLDELYAVIKHFTQKQGAPQQALLEHVDRLMERMAAQNVAYSEEEVADDIEAARRDVAA